MAFAKYLNLVIAENKKEFIYIRHYIVENVARMLILFLLFMVVFFATAHFDGSKSPETSRNIVSFQLIGYSFWIVALSCIDVFTVAVREDAEIGVLESLALSHFGLIAIFMSRTLSRLVVDALAVALVSALVLALAPVRMDIAALPLAMAVLAITIIGLYGVGLALAGMALLLKRVTSLKALLNYFFLIAGGVFVPVAVLPAPLAASIHYLPLTLGIDLARQALLGEMGPNYALKLGWLIVLSVIYFVAGVHIFKYFEKVAKRRGALASY